LLPLAAVLMGVYLVLRILRDAGRGYRPAQPDDTGGESRA